MTYCIGLLLEEGVVMLSDTRTNAGVDNIACFKKSYHYERSGECVISIMAAGSLSVTQNVITHLEEGIKRHNPKAKNSPKTNGDIPYRSIIHMTGIEQVVRYVGDLVAAYSKDIQEKLGSDNHLGKASFILAGQYKGRKLKLFLIYPEGNHIKAQEDTPFMQIGEMKYGKPILDQIITHTSSLKDGEKAAMLSMASTLRSNLSVGMPLDITIIKIDDLKISQHYRIEKDDKDFTNLSNRWSNFLLEGFNKISFP